MILPAPWLYSIVQYYKYNNKEVMCYGCSQREAQKSIACLALTENLVNISLGQDGDSPRFAEGSQDFNQEGHDIKMNSEFVV